jgi:peptide/nickel transport system ATP-binding protein
MKKTTLAVRDLSITYADGRRAVRGVSFDVAENESLALVGESGCGKSSIARAILGLLPKGTDVCGSIKLGGQELVGASTQEMRALRGLIVGYVAQSPFDAYNPLHTVLRHVAEAWNAHDLAFDNADVAARLERLGIAAPGKRMLRYPHQWSGGMLQRACIAAASAHAPTLIVADEPTSAIDHERANDIMTGLTRQKGSLVLISHDVQLVAQHVDRVAICYAGEIVELADASAAFVTPRHPYTLGLAEAVPSRVGRLPIPLAGELPDGFVIPAGCAFEPRCSRSTAVCRQAEPALADGVACFHPLATRVSQPLSKPPVVARPLPQPVVLSARGLVKTYRDRRGSLPAVIDASLDIRRGEIVGISGRSGSGKSTLLQMIAGIEAPDAGAVERRTRNTIGTSAGVFAMPVFQDAIASLDPRWPIWRTVSEPATARGRNKLDRPSLRQLAEQLLVEVGLQNIDLEARPHELSGGQCQRVSIARALCARPSLIIADEPTSALDASVSARILQLFRKVADDGTAILIVSHNLAMLSALSDRVLRMQDGRLIPDDNNDQVC